MRVRGTQLLAIGLLVAATTACGGGLGSASSPPDAVATSASPEGGPAARLGGSPVPAGRPTPSRTTPGRTAAPANRPARTTAPAAPPAPACAARDLTASEGRTGLPADGDSGWFGTPIVLRNHSSSACRLRGWPGLTFFGDAVVRVCAKGDPSPSCGKPTSTSGTRPFAITRSSAHSLPDIALAPGHSTSFTLVWQGSYFCGALVDAPYGVDIRVPGDSHVLTLLPTAQISPCEGRIEVTPFGVVG
ncbi:DUF4232 domain-containing protein [Streptomyces diastatochromogenes]|uniref:DUF4232 domain-containing protein n=1 Tax=Streptomyces diastatochromogenes TaxID=42236 RepID=UPI00117CAE8A|nr:DUF4232 domain-containing protein [Streptomyces diastatochromogenes]